jgi:ribosome maturation factor RimP
MSDYGTTQHEGKTIILDDQADFTSRLMPYLPYHEAGEGDTYYFEMSAPGHDEAGNDCTVYWEFAAVKGEERELDTYDYSNAIRVIWD